MHLKTTEGDIDTTTNHPFYVISKGWVAAGDLEIGDEILTIDGEIGYVLSFELEKLDAPIPVYNIEVVDFHTYFVGDGNGWVLVHNQCVPVKNKTTAANGLDYQSNTKHTPGQQGFRANAGTEPGNSLELFGESVASASKPGQRFSFDRLTNTLHRFFNDGNGTWHWSGSTNQGANSITGSQVPNDIKNIFGLPKKGW